MTGCTGSSSSIFRFLIPSRKLSPPNRIPTTIKIVAYHSETILIPKSSSIHHNAHVIHHANTKENNPASTQCKTIWITPWYILWSFLFLVHRVKINKDTIAVACMSACLINSASEALSRDDGNMNKYVMKPNNNNHCQIICFFDSSLNLFVTAADPKTYTPNISNIFSRKSIRLDHKFKKLSQIKISAIAQIAPKTAVVIGYIFIVSPRVEKRLLKESMVSRKSKISYIFQ